MDDGKWDPDKLADGRRDFREEVEEREELKLSADSPPTARGGGSRRGKKTREQVNASRGFRLAPDVRAHLVFELLTTNKSFTALAREFGVHVSSVQKLFKRLSSRPRVQLLYRKDGTPFWAWKSGK